MSRPARGTAATWRNRIVGYEQVSVEAIQANPRIEQTVINNNRDLLEFHKRWMQKVLEGGIWRGRKAKPAKRP